jgi:hypothetical protein
MKLPELEKLERQTAIIRHQRSKLTANLQSHYTECALKNGIKSQNSILYVRIAFIQSNRRHGN